MKKAKSSLILYFLGITAVSVVSMILGAELISALFLFGLLLVPLLWALKTGDTLVEVLIYCLPLYISLNISKRLIFNETIRSQTFVEGYQSNYLVPTVSLVHIAAFCLVFVFILNQKDKLKFIKDIFTKKIFSLLIGLFALHLYWHFSFLTVINLFKLGLKFGVFFIILSKFKSLKWKKFSSVFFVATLIQLLISVLQFYNGTSLGLEFLGESQVQAGRLWSSYTDIGGDLYLRAYGTFAHPNILGGWAAFTFIISFYQVSKRFSWLDFGIIVSCITLVLLSFSLSALIVVIVVSLLHLAVNYRERFFTFTPILMFNEFLISESVQDRLELVDSSISIIRENWLKGVGIGRFVSVGSAYLPRYSNGLTLYQPVHNVPLLILSEWGIVLGLALLLAFAYCLYRFWREVDWQLFIYLMVWLVVEGGVDHYLFIN